MDNMNTTTYLQSEESDSQQTFIAMTKPDEGTVFERCGMNKDIPVICSTDVM